MTLKQWEKKVLEAPGAQERVREIEEELRLAAGLTALREQAGLSQRQLAKRLGVSQPRIAAIEGSRNITVEVLKQYAYAFGGELEISIVRGRQRTPLLGPSKPARRGTPAGGQRTKTRSTSGRRSAETGGAVAKQRVRAS